MRVRRQNFEMREKRRDTPRGAHRARTERLDRLFYEMTEDEYATYPSRSGPRSMGARSVMIDALLEMGSPRTAEALRRLGQGRLHGTLLEDKIRRTIFGPTTKSTYSPRKPKKTIWLARVVERGRADRWIALQDKDIARSGWGAGYGEPYLFEIGMGYSSLYKLVYADGADEALEEAESRWPHLFLDELDKDEIAEIEEEGEDFFPHPVKRGVMVRRSDDVYMIPPAESSGRATYPGSGRGGPFVHYVVRARIVDADRRLAAFIGTTDGRPGRPTTGGLRLLEPTLVEYER